MSHGNPCKLQAEHEELKGKLRVGSKSIVVPKEGPHQQTMRIIIECVDDTMTHWTGYEEMGSMSSWPLLSYL